MDSFNISEFWSVIWRNFTKIGYDIMFQVLCMYYCFVDPNTPVWVKGLIVPAIVYLISPIDAIPDFLPGGFVDDGAVIAGVFKAIEMHITEEHKRQASETLKGMFGY